MDDLLLADLGLIPEDYLMIEAEHARQIDEWGYQEHSAFTWLGLITEEQGELSKAISEYVYCRGGDLKAIEEEAVQVATLALKMAAMVKELRGARDDPRACVRCGILSETLRDGKCPICHVSLGGYL